MRIGAKVPNSGQLPATLGIGTMAAELERAGFDSLWVSDHVVMPGVVRQGRTCGTQLREMLSRVGDRDDWAVLAQRLH